MVDLNVFNSLFDLTLRDIKSKGLEDWILYGVTLSFYKDLKDGLLVFKNSDPLIEYLKVEERFEDLVWIRDEIEGLEDKILSLIIRDRLPLYQAMDDRFFHELNVLVDNFNEDFQTKYVIVSENKYDLGHIEIIREN
jgi:hypothetical protein